MSFPVACANPRCGIHFALGVLRCPRCQTVSPQYAKKLQEDAVPRITVANGPTNPDAKPGEVGYIPPPQETPASPAGDVAAAPEDPAVPAAATGAGPQAATPPPDGPAPDYDALTVAQLREAAKERRLPVGGTKAELVERLTAATEPAARE